MDERWHGNLFQNYEATDANDLDFAIVVFRVGTHIDKEEEDRSDRVGIYRGKPSLLRSKVVLHWIAMTHGRMCISVRWCHIMIDVEW